MQYRRIGLVLPLRVTRSELRVAGFAFLVFFNPHLATRNPESGTQNTKLETLKFDTLVLQGQDF